jgi:DNA-binding protein HU-beta
VNTAELIAAVADKTGKTKKEAEASVNAVLDIIQATLVKRDKVQLIGFGTFETTQRKARKGRNPRKPDEVMDIPASTAPKFKAGKALKDSVNKK